MPTGTGPGSFPLAKIVAANGKAVQGRFQRYGLAVTCALAFMVQLRVKVTLSSSVTCPVLCSKTLHCYVDREFLQDFTGGSAAKAGFKRVL